MSITPPPNNQDPSRDVFLRQIILSDMLEGVVNLPHGLKHRFVEVILLPIEDQPLPSEEAARPVFSLQPFSGAWHGEPLAREEQGVYEQRDNLE